MRSRSLSGVTPSGPLTIGNYLGAIRQFVVQQDQVDGFYFVADLHALTTDADPATLAQRSLSCAAVLYGAGLDPNTSTVFIQSHVRAHTELAYLLECTAYVGELRRMIQFKEKGNGPKVRTSLLTYPCLMAADILLYSPEEVPVGEDQRQHIELCRDLAHRFNEEYGKVFTVPGIRVPKHGARLADLSDPSRKMSKSAPVDSMGVVRILDTPEVIRKKFKRAVTDSENVVAYDPDRKPGVSTLLGIIGEISGRGPEEIAAEIGGYADLKARCADAVIQALAPIREAHDVYMGDPAELRRLLDAGAARAAAVADEKLALAREAIGLDRRPDGR